MNRVGSLNTLYRKMVNVACIDTMEESCFPRGKTVFLLVLLLYPLIHVSHSSPLLSESKDANKSNTLGKHPVTQFEVTNVKANCTYCLG